MSKYRFELVLAGVLLLLFLGVSSWQSASTLSQSDVDAYIGTLDEGLPAAMPNREEFLSRLRGMGRE